MDILDFIARDSRQDAFAAVLEIEDRAVKLEDFPRLGHVVAEFEEETLRELMVFQYRVIYRIYSDRISIVAVVHGAQLLPGALEGRPLA